MPVKDRILDVDPKKLHGTVPWSSETKCTVIANTVGGVKKAKGVGA